MQSRLAALLKSAFPTGASVREVSAVLGGRNDLIQYSFEGRRVVFEIFCSKSQVPKDLRLLEQCEAAVKIAVLIDEHIDNGVSTEYFRKKPNAFPFLWLRDVLNERRQEITVARLRELIDENSSIVKIRKMLEGKHGLDVDQAMRKVVERFESLVESRNLERRPLADLTGVQVIALWTLSEVKATGVPVERLRSLYLWLCDSVEYAMQVIATGFQAFLVTDLRGENAIWSDGDVVDDLILCRSDLPKASIVVCLNPVVNNFLKKVGRKPFETTFHLVHSCAEFANLDGRERSSNDDPN